MLYPWVKTLVGAALTANFSFPLITVLINRLLWEEPMAVLAGNMSLTCTLFGLCIMLIGLYDVASLQSVALCRFLQYSGFSVGTAFKAAQTCAAIDQFVAVTQPLLYYPVMMRALKWLFALTWVTWAVQLVFGLVAHFLDLETFAERAVRLGGNSTYTGCRWETALSNVYTVLAELQLVGFSVVTASLLIYTGVIGHTMKRRLIRRVQEIQQNGARPAPRENAAFLENYRAFKSIVAVLTLTVTLDMVTPVLRILSRWYPQPTLNGHLL
ncbi:hypothetical protein FJT64_019552 [Amphibalanus amphitrite]|uniref:G-protein coupled receptors family 1 profile domain-containing protein n=1 Tax=Amphibalanus amphitrite TaxID=1232801 RepID=A0A6A4WTH6_AMPAM|nr:hypothetical protein FJT64_019552 [Amphibalanus amphitrite]